MKTMMRNIPLTGKRSFGVAAALALVVSLAAGVALAQAPAGDGKAGKAGEAGRRGGGRMGINPRIAEQLNLTDAQKARIQSIQQEARGKAQALRADAKLSDEQKKAQGRELMKATREKIEGVLTAEQKAKLKQLRDQARERAAERGKGAKPGIAGKPTA